MRVVEQLIVGGAAAVTSADGKIIINQETGNIVVRNPSTGKILLKIDNNGMQINGEAGNKMINLDTSGLHVHRAENGRELATVDSNGMTYADQDGTKRIRIGLNPKTHSVGEYVSIPNEDVIEALLEDDDGQSE